MKKRAALRPPPSALIALSLFLLPFSLGCAKHKKHADAGSDKPKKEAEMPVKAVASGPGDVTVYQTADANALPSFNVHWTSSQFDAAKGTVSTGHMEKPQGQIFTNGKASSTYRADTGDAIREVKRLDMRGNVVLRSIDQTQTLKSPVGEYRGDVKIVRAMGGVVATGPFGTLSGVPELWATPDLRLIGTPDMVSQTLKIPALIALAATAAVGSGKLQKGNDYTFGNLGPVSGKNLGAEGYRIVAKPKPGGPLVIVLASRGITIHSAGTVTILTDPKGNEVRHMTSEGTVNVVQTAPTGTTTMDGVGSVYETDGGETATLDVGGPVTLVNAVKGPNGTQTTTSHGQKGHAVLLNKPTAGANALRSATLTGSVTIDSRGTGDDTFAGKGDVLVYTPHPDSSDVDLSGKAVLTRVTKAKDGSTSTVVSRGDRAHGVLDPTPAAGANPLKTATLFGGVTIDVSGTNGQTFKGSGDKVVYTSQGEGGRAVMTGDLKFSGDAPTFLSNVTDADTAVVTIGKSGWQTVDVDNSGGKPTTTVITTKTPPSAPKPKGKTPKGKKVVKP